MQVKQFIWLFIRKHIFKRAMENLDNNRTNSRRPFTALRWVYFRFHGRTMLIAIWTLFCSLTF